MTLDLLYRHFKINILSSNPFLFSNFSGCQKVSIILCIWYFYFHLASVTNEFQNGATIQNINYEKWQNPINYEKREANFLPILFTKFPLLFLSSCSPYGTIKILTVFFSLLILLVLTCDHICNRKAYLAEK